MAKSYHVTRAQIMQARREGQAYLALPTSNEDVRERYVERAFQCFEWAEEAEATMSRKVKRNG